MSDYTQDTISAATPRGIRNNNPGNIRRSSDDWQGLSPAQTDPDFLQFQAAIWGIRAMAEIFHNYQLIDHLYTLYQLISRWAPPTENDTNTYIASVSAATGLSSNQTIDLTHYSVMAPLVKSVIQHENGIQPYSDSTIDSALAMLGIVAPAAPGPQQYLPALPNSKAANPAALPRDELAEAVSRGPTTMKAAGLAISGGVLSVLKPLLDDIVQDQTIGHDLLRLAPWLAVIMIFGGIGWILWEWHKNHP